MHESESRLSGAGEPPRGDQLDSWGDQLDSWKEIATYLNRGVTTVQRWESQEGLPIRRHHHENRSSVYALKSELDAWKNSRHPETAEAADAGEAAKRSWPRAVVMPVSLVVAMACALALWGAARSATPADKPSPINAIQVAPSEELLEGPGPSIAISPDVRLVVYTARGDGVEQLYLRRLDQVAATPLRGTERGRSPFFSPDGKWVAFFADNQLKKIAVDSGQIDVLCPTSSVTAGGSWGVDDRIVFGQFGHGLHAVNAGGGDSHSITAPNAAAGEVDHRWPDVLPDGAVLFTAWTGSTAAARIAVRSPAGASHSILLAGTQPRILQRNRIVFARGDAVWTAGFDPVRMTITGEAVRLLDAVLPRQGGAADYATAANGAFAYVPSRLADTNVVEWVNPDRRSTPITEDGFHGSPRLSPDGSRLAVMTRTPDGMFEIWIHDLVTGGRLRLPINSSAIDPVWSPDGRRITYASTEHGPSSLYSIAADGKHTRELLLSSGFGLFPLSWSARGVLAFHQVSPVTSHDIWLLTPVEAPSPLLTSPFAETQAQFSPDGRWLAYVSDDSGRNEVYVIHHATGRPPERISRGGGVQPVWSRDGHSLYYRNLTGELLFRVGLTLAPALAITHPVLVLDGPYEMRARAGAMAANYDVAADGRLVMVRQRQRAMRQEIRIGLHWSALITKALPAP